MTLQEKQEEVIEDFAIFDDWMEKYEYLIELGKDLPKIADDKKTEDRIIEGCQSKVWLDAEFREGTMHFKADSDAIITKGIIGLLIRVLDNETPEEILKKYYPQIIFVLLQREKDKGPIKSYLDSKGVVSQFMLQKNMQKKVKVMGVMTNLLR